MSNLINSFFIDSSEIPQSGGERSYVINGDVGSSFKLQVIQASTSSNKYYNFKTKVFEDTFSSSSYLNHVMVSRVKRGKIFFPAATLKNYKILLIADENTSVETANSRVKNISIVQGQDIVVTFNVATSFSDNYESLSGKSTNVSRGATSNFKQTITNSRTISGKNNDVNGQGNGLILNSSLGVVSDGSGLISPEGTPNELFYYVEKSTTVDGTVSSSGFLVLDDVNNITAGSNSILYINDGEAAKILGVNTETKTLTLSENVSASDGDTVKIRSYGKNIFQSYNLAIKVPSLTVSPQLLTTTIRGVVNNSTTITVNGSRGIGGSNTARFEGAGVVQTGANNINTVSLSETAGSFVCDEAQTLKPGTIITILNSFKEALVKDRVEITSFPSSNLEVFLDLDKIFTRGSA
tara:strand:- start:2162 stop:3388 length:1227 start_codon:yes stop_codon:yes gene_type:complete